QRAGTGAFYVCRCFHTDNIYLEDQRLHVRFETEQQFRLDYRELLRERGCVTEHQFADVLNKVSQEVDRRLRLDVTSAERSAAIREAYRPLHPQVYNLQERYLAPRFRQIVQYCQRTDATKEGLLAFLEEAAGAVGVYRFPVFEKSFCEQLLEELEHFEQSSAPKGRPNTMNRHGVLLNELGLDEGFITPLREHYLQPVSALLYPECGGGRLDSHKAFVVKYDMKEDVELSYHYDNAEVTLNASIGKEFTDGNLYFGALKQVPLGEAECSEVEHRVSEGLLHRGQHMHGALPISSGQRWNLIVWMRASQERNGLCPMCNRRPLLVEGQGFADGFTRGAEASADWSCVLT
uniref:2-oxoglutarate and iron-dependent oxygenase domain containing 2 n=1 Tax=Tetraodon nigroviridis TaxID=99883 RepID=H3DNF3_TETNG